MSGPTNEPDPPGVKVVHIETAREMLAACEAALPVDIAVFAAAVADWRADAAPSKLKKKGGAVPALTLIENPAGTSSPPCRKRAIAGPSW